MDTNSEFQNSANGLKFEIAKSLGIRIDTPKEFNPLLAFTS